MVDNTMVVIWYYHIISIKDESYIHIVVPRRVDCRKDLHSSYISLCRILMNDIYIYITSLILKEKSTQFISQDR